MRIDCGSATHAGKVQQHNEDFHIVDPDLGLVVLCDGYGEDGSGAVPARVAAEAVQASYRRLSVPGVAASGPLLDAVEDAGVAVSRRVKQDGVEAGTTVVAAAMDGREVHVAWVGDSRAYLLRQGTLMQLTTDHSVAQGLVERGILTVEQARFHRTASMLTRVLDGPRRLSTPQFGSMQLMPRDRLMLCSDGMSNEASLEVMERVLLRDDPAECSRNLVRTAFLGPASDNVTAVVVDVATVY